jgi:hypothetical protein
MVTAPPTPHSPAWPRGRPVLAALAPTLFVVYLATAAFYGERDALLVVGCLELWGLGVILLYHRIASVLTSLAAIACALVVWIRCVSAGDNLPLFLITSIPLFVTLLFVGGGYAWHALFGK